MSTTGLVDASEGTRMEEARALGRSVVAEVVYTTQASGGSGLDATVVYPLTYRGEIVVALPFARRELAEALGDARAVALVGSDARLVLRGWAPTAAVGRFRVRADFDGHWFVEHLLEEELRRYPPSRLLADSLMQRREHWWYLPRMLCTLEASSFATHVVAREDPQRTGVLAWEAADGLRVDTVAVPDLDADRPVVRSLGGTAIAGAADPACLLLHDYSVPDLERRCELVLTGRLEGDRLAVSSRRGRADLPGPDSLLRRWRAARALARDCRDELARAREWAQGVAED